MVRNKTTRLNKHRNNEHDNQFKQRTRTKSKQTKTLNYGGPSPPTRAETPPPPCIPSSCRASPSEAPRPSPRSRARGEGTPGSHARWPADAWSPIPPGRLCTTQSAAGPFYTARTPHAAFCALRLRGGANGRLAGFALHHILLMSPATLIGRHIDWVWFGN